MSWRRSNWLKITAIAVIITFVPVQTAFARGRRGGNSGGALAVAAIGGAALPLAAVVGAHFAPIALAPAIGTAGGATLSFPLTYPTSLAISSVGLAVGNVAGAGMAAGGVDPHTSTLISAGISAGVSSIGGLIAAPAGAFASAGVAYGTSAATMQTAFVASQFTSSLVGAEVGYQLNKAGVPLGGLIGGLAGGLAGGVVGGTIRSGNLGSGLSSGWQNTFALKNLVPRLASGLVSEGVSYGMRAIAGENSPALRYAGSISSLASSLTSYGTSRYVVSPVMASLRRQQRPQPVQPSLPQLSPAQWRYAERKLDQILYLPVPGSGPPQIQQQPPEIPVHDPWGWSRRHDGPLPPKPFDVGGERPIMDWSVFTPTPTPAQSPMPPISITPYMPTYTLPDPAQWDRAGRKLDQILYLPVPGSGPPPNMPTYTLPDHVLSNFSATLSQFNNRQLGSQLYNSQQISIYDSQIRKIQSKTLKAGFAEDGFSQTIPRLKSVSEYSTEDLEKRLSAPQH